MATVTIDIAAGNLSEVLDAIATNTGYTSPAANGMTKAQWVNDQLKAWIVGHVASVRSKNAYTAAYNATAAQLTITVT